MQPSSAWGVRSLQRLRKPGQPHPVAPGRCEALALAEAKSGWESTGHWANSFRGHTPCHSVTCRTVNIPSFQEEKLVILGSQGWTFPRLLGNCWLFFRSVIWQPFTPWGDGHRASPADRLVLGLRLYRALPGEHQLAPSHSLKGKQREERNQVKCQSSLEKTGTNSQRGLPEGAGPEVRPWKTEWVLGEKLKSFPNGQEWAGGRDPEERKFRAGVPLKLHLLMISKILFNFSKTRMTSQTLCNQVQTCDFSYGS